MSELLSLTQSVHGVHDGRPAADSDHLVVLLQTENIQDGGREFDFTAAARNTITLE